MLVVKSPNPSEKNRVDIEQVHARLFKMLIKCDDDRDYTSKPAPWPRRKGDYKTLEEAVETDVANVPQDILRWKELRVHRGRTLVRDRVCSFPVA